MNNTNELIITLNTSGLNDLLLDCIDRQSYGNLARTCKEAARILGKPSSRRALRLLLPKNFSSIVPASLNAQITSLGPTYLKLRTSPNTTVRVECKREKNWWELKINGEIEKVDNRSALIKWAQTLRCLIAPREASPSSTPLSKKHLKSLSQGHPAPMALESYQFLFKQADVSTIYTFRVYEPPNPGQGNE